MSVGSMLIHLRPNSNRRNGSSGVSSAKEIHERTRDRKVFTMIFWDAKETLLVEFQPKYVFQNPDVQWTFFGNFAEPHRINVGENYPIKFFVDGKSYTCIFWLFQRRIVSSFYAFLEPNYVRFLFIHCFPQHFTGKKFENTKAIKRKRI